MPFILSLALVIAMLGVLCALAAFFFAPLFLQAPRRCRACGRAVAYQTTCPRCAGTTFDVPSPAPRWILTIRRRVFTGLLVGVLAIYALSNFWMTVLDIPDGLGVGIVPGGLFLLVDKHFIPQGIIEARNGQPFGWWFTVEPRPCDYGISIPIWIPALLFAIPTFWPQIPRFKRGLCPHCGYDLRASPPGTPCSECGSIAPAARA